MLPPFSSLSLLAYIVITLYRYLFEDVSIAMTLMISHFHEWPSFQVASTMSASLQRRVSGMDAVYGMRVRRASDAGLNTARYHDERDLLYLYCATLGCIAVRRLSGHHSDNKSLRRKALRTTQDIGRWQQEQDLLPACCKSLRKSRTQYA